uniref:Uncharacterized protein n=1 Tax=Caenorhabditis japonica TaxID=281687 RepID=A0A8R1IBQ1_CAEJA
MSDVLLVPDLIQNLNYRLSNMMAGALWSGLASAVEASVHFIALHYWDHGPVRIHTNLGTNDVTFRPCISSSSLLIPAG